jgi:hypothetical protein
MRKHRILRFHREHSQDAGTPVFRCLFVTAKRAQIIPAKAIILFQPEAVRGRLNIQATNMDTR